MIANFDYYLFKKTGKVKLHVKAEAPWRQGDGEKRKSDGYNDDNGPEQPTKKTRVRSV